MREFHLCQSKPLQRFAAALFRAVGADKEIAEEVAQRIRNVVFATTLEVDVKIVRIKVNVGAASFPESGNNLAAVMAAADRAMYKDKDLREPPKGKLIIQKR